MYIYSKVRMPSPLSLRSYLKPATSTQVPKMYNEVQNLGLFSIDFDIIRLIFHHIPLRPTIHLLWHTWKWSRNVKNKKCIARYFTSLFSHFAPLFSLFAFCTRKVKGFRGLFFHSINKTWNSHEIWKVYSKCFVFCDVFRENIRKIPAKYKICMAAIKSRINVLFKIFSMIRIDQQNLNHKFWGFILSVPWGQQRTKCLCHAGFFHQSGTFLICFSGNVCCFAWSLGVRWLHSDNMNTLSMWSCKTKVDEVSTVLIHIRILKFSVFAFHQGSLSSFTSILISQPD